MTPSRPALRVPLLALGLATSFGLGACRPSAEKTTPRKSEPVEATAGMSGMGMGGMGMGGKQIPKVEEVIAEVAGESIDKARLQKLYRMKIDRITTPNPPPVQHQRWMRRVAEELVWQKALELDSEELDSLSSGFLEERVNMLFNLYQYVLMVSPMATKKPMMMLSRPDPLPGSR